MLKGLAKRIGYEVTKFENETVVVVRRRTETQDLSNIVRNSNNDRHFRRTIVRGMNFHVCTCISASSYEKIVVMLPVQASSLYLVSILAYDFLLNFPPSIACTIQIASGY